MVIEQLGDRTIEFGPNRMEESQGKFLDSYSSVNGLTRPQFETITSFEILVKSYKGWAWSFNYEGWAWLFYTKGGHGHLIVLSPLMLTLMVIEQLGDRTIVTVYA